MLAFALSVRAAGCGGVGEVAQGVVGVCLAPSGGLDAGDPNSANLYKLSAAEREAAGIDVLPGNLLDATRELAQNDALRAGFGKTRDGDYLDYFVECKQREVLSAHEQVTQWELDRYLQLF